MNAQLAAHESAHAIIREVLGGRVHYVSIADADNPHVRVAKSCSEPLDEYAVLLAGMAAEFLFYPEAAARVGHFGGDDWERVPEHARQQAAQRAKALVRTYRHKIRKLADELLRKETVLGARVREIAGVR